MSVTTTDGSELDRRTRTALERTVGLLREVDPALPLRGGEWTCGDVAVHLLDVSRRYTRRDFREREGLTDSPAALSRGNRDGVAGYGSVPHAEVLDRLETESAALLALDLPLHEHFPFHAGQFIDGAGARSNWIGELLLHGHDVARAARRAWPLDPRDMTLVLNGVFQVAPGWLDPRRSAAADLTVAVRIAGATPQLFVIAGGLCRIRDVEPGDRADAVIAAPPVPLALLLYHRIGLLTAARRGVLVVGGRRPWVGLRLTSMFLDA